MPLKAKLYLTSLDFVFFDPCFGPRPHMGSINLWTQNHPQVVGTCHGHGLQVMAQNRSFEPLPPP